MEKIQSFEIYFEPQGAVKETLQLGEEVLIPLQKVLPAAIQTADQILGMGGMLATYASDRSLNVQVTDEKSDAEWASFIGDKCLENTQWKRWNGGTTQGRWNVIVFLVKSSAVRDIRLAGQPEFENNKRKQQDEIGTSLRIALNKGDMEIVRLLIDAGADVDSAINLARREGNMNIGKMFKKGRASTKSFFSFLK